MKESLPEFSRPLKVDRVPRGGSTEKLVAGAHECAAMAKRLDVPAVHDLRATLRATPWRGGGLKLDGELVAGLDQVSVVSLETFRSEVRIPLLRYYLPEGAKVSDEEEADPIIAGHVDMGEAVAETLTLELDPYPRKAGEDFDAAGIEEAPPVKPESPFAALKNLKKDKG